MTNNCLLVYLFLVFQFLIYINCNQKITVIYIISQKIYSDAKIKIFKMLIFFLALPLPTYEFDYPRSKLP